MRKYIRSLVPGILLLGFLSGCTSYRQITLGPREFYEEKDVTRKIDRYTIYLHEGDDLYIVQEPYFKDDTLKGTLVEAETAVEKTVRKQKQKEIRKEKYDIHIYKRPDREEQLEKQLRLPDSQVERVEMYAKDSKKTFGTIALIFGAVAVAFLLVYGLLLLAIKGSEDASDDGSGSNSNSDSGDSDSGGSDSKCYVATMVYGACDAEEVLVLRKFRDRFLKKSAAGRAFIRWYYANSPGFVERHRDSHTMHRAIRFLLDRFVRFLQLSGYRK